MRRPGARTGGTLRLALLTAAAVAVAACGAGGNDGNGGDAGGGQNGGATPAQETPREPTTPPVGGAKDGAAGANGGQNRDEPAYERDWRVGDGGAVEVRFRGGELELLGARPNDGWDVDVEEQDADEIEVRFARADEEWRFDAEVEDGRLEVETGQKLRDAEDGTYRLGDAGAVEVRRQGGGISLVQTRSTGNWGSNVVRQDGEEVEVRFERPDERWTLEAEVDDGRLEVDTVRRVTEPVRR